jgi:hypothetical protein
LFPYRTTTELMDERPHVFARWMLQSGNHDRELAQSAHSLA